MITTADKSEKRKSGVMEKCWTFTEAGQTYLKAQVGKEKPKGEKAVISTFAEGARMP